jgi:hypothetical protein
MDDSLFNDYIERIVLSLYPNISKTARFDANCELLCGPVILKVDSGPGQIIANLNSISKLAAFRELGLLILMGLLNATSVNQEMDALYGSFKAATYARGEVNLTERMQLRGLERSAAAAAAGNGATAVPTLTLFAMGFEDTSTVVNGNSTDDVSMKPFTRTFTREKILRSWLKVGFCPLTRNCIQNKKVRHELGQALQDKVLKDLHKSYTGVVRQADEEGLNAGIFDGSLWQSRSTKNSMKMIKSRCLWKQRVHSPQVHSGMLYVAQGSGMQASS